MTRTSSPTYGDNRNTLKARNESPGSTLKIPATSTKVRNPVTGNYKASPREQPSCHEATNKSTKKAVIGRTGKEQRSTWLARKCYSKTKPTIPNINYDTT